MIRTIVKKGLEDGPFYMELSGLHNDSKPTGVHIATGSLMLEVDTGDVYAYDEAGSEWNKIAALGGSGS